MRRRAPSELEDDSPLAAQRTVNAQTAHTALMYLALLLTTVASAVLVVVLERLFVWWVLRTKDTAAPLEAPRGRPRFIVLSVRVQRRTDWRTPQVLALHTGTLTPDDGACTLDEHTLHCNDLRVSRVLLARGLLTAANAAAELAERLDARLVIHVEHLLDVSIIDHMLMDFWLEPLEEQAFARGGVLVHGPSLAVGALMMTEWPGPVLHGNSGLRTLFSVPLDLGPGDSFTLVDGITQRVYRRQAPRSHLGTPPGRGKRAS